MVDYRGGPIPRILLLLCASFVPPYELYASMSVPLRLHTPDLHFKLSLSKPPTEANRHSRDPSWSAPGKLTRERCGFLPPPPFLPQPLEEEFFIAKDQVRTFTPPVPPFLSLIRRRDFSSPQRATVHFSRWIVIGAPSEPFPASECDGGSRLNGFSCVSFALIPGTPYPEGGSEKKKTPPRRLSLCLPFGAC